jgi:hypothetical protein
MVKSSNDEIILFASKTKVELNVLCEKYGVSKNGNKMKVAERLLNCMPRKKTNIKIEPNNNDNSINEVVGESFGKQLLIIFARYNESKFKNFKFSLLWFPLSAYKFCFENQKECKL